MEVIPYDPNFTSAMGRRARGVEDKEHDASASAAIVAVALISSARLELKLDSVYTEYSAQYLVDNASTKSKKKKRGKNSKLTVKKCLEFELKKGIPKAQDWPQLGSVSKPPLSHKPALVSMKGEVIEAKSLEEACDWLTDQPLGAKLHVFSPQIDLVGEGVYCGSSGEATGYVGLRDGMIVGVEKIQGKSIASVALVQEQVSVGQCGYEQVFCRLRSGYRANNSAYRFLCPTPIHQLRKEPVPRQAIKQKLRIRLLHHLFTIS